VSPLPWKVRLNGARVLMLSYAISTLRDAQPLTAIAAAAASATRDRLVFPELRTMDLHSPVAIGTISDGVADSNR
jgi:hypothetical protein